jgi:hypothetical protein
MVPIRHLEIRAPRGGWQGRGFWRSDGEVWMQRDLQMQRPLSTPIGDCEPAPKESVSTRQADTRNSWICNLAAPRAPRLEISSETSIPARAPAGTGHSELVPTHFSMACQKRSCAMNIQKSTSCPRAACTASPAATWTYSPWKVSHRFARQFPSTMVHRPTYLPAVPAV